MLPLANGTLSNVPGTLLGTNVSSRNMLPDSTKNVILVASFVLLVIGIPGNLLVIWTFLKVKRLRVNHNVFVVSLAFVDTVIIGYLLPNNVASLLRGVCPISRNMCLLNGIIAHVCFTTSVQTIMVIAINRFVKICCTPKYEMIFENRNVAFIIVYTYSVGPIFLVPLFIMGDNQLVYDATLQMCIFDRYGNWRYTTIYQTLCLALPILITGYCYCSIYRTVMKTRSQVMQRYWNNGLQKRRIQHELAVTRSQFAIFVAYLVLYIPFGVTAVFVTDRLAVPVSLHAAGIYLCYLNSCINGLIYGLLNKNIQQAYREAIPCFGRKNNVIVVQAFLGGGSNEVAKKAVATQTDSCV